MLSTSRDLEERSLITGPHNPKQRTPQPVFFSPVALRTRGRDTFREELVKDGFGFPRPAKMGPNQATAPLTVTEVDFLKAWFTAAVQVIISITALIVVVASPVQPPSTSPQVVASPSSVPATR